MMHGGRTQGKAPLNRLPGNSPGEFMAGGHRGIRSPVLKARVAARSALCVGMYKKPRFE